MTAVLELALGLVSLESVLGKVLEPDAGLGIPPFVGWIEGETRQVVCVCQRTAVYIVDAADPYTRKTALFAAIYVDPADVAQPARATMPQALSMRRPVVADKVCTTCGTTFTPIKSYQQFCKPSCRWSASHEPRKLRLQLKPKAPPIIRLCEICKAPIEVKPNAWHTRFCGRDCYNMSRSRRRKEGHNWNNDVRAERRNGAGKIEIPK